jgi:F-type H+-transporting ATPase subunit alpha
VQNGYVDDVPVDRIKDFQASLTDYLSTHKAEFLRRIASEKVLTDSLKTELKSSAEQFKQTWR